MSKRLEHFIKDNRDSFDTENPSPGIWEDIEKKMTGNHRGKPVYFMKKKWWAVAATVAALTITIAAYIVFQQTQDMAGVNEINKANVQQKKEHDIDIADIDPGYAKQVAQFSEAIEDKQRALQAIRVEQPALYEQFSDDIKHLDSTYYFLKHKLPVNPNKEELLQAMIYNLQLQINLLNQQLNIIQKIKQSKSKSL